MQAKMRSQIGRRWLPRRLGNGFKMAPGGLPGASREPKLIFNGFLASLGALLGAPGALLGWSWDLLGRSRALLGRSWGSFWPPGAHFCKLFGRYFWRLGPGPSKIMFFLSFLVFMYFVLVIFLILSCLPSGDPGGQANFEKS